MKTLRAMKNKPSKRKRIRDRNAAIRFASKIMRHKSGYVILEVETTGLGPHDVIISLAITDMDGRVLLDTHVKPAMKTEIPRNVTILTGISMEMLRDAPGFGQVYPKFQEITRDKTILTYDTGFTGEYLKETIWQEGLRIKTPRTKPFAQYYAMFKGDWLPERKRYRIPLINAPERTLVADCRAEVMVLQEMADDKPEGKVWWWLW